MGWGYIGKANIWITKSPNYSKKQKDPFIIRYRKQVSMKAEYQLTEAQKFRLSLLINQRDTIQIELKKHIAQIEPKVTSNT